MKFTALFFTLFWASGLIAQQEGFSIGTITDSIDVQGSNGESYALFLPDGFDLKSPTPIVFIFDPAGRGKSGIEPFTEAARKYGLILICSNTSRNMAYDQNFAIADRLFQDVFSRFLIDQNRIYAAGFSGGSRLASAIGVMTAAFKGIVGCGAGFSINPGQAPYSNDHFYYAGLVGHLDMNYQEMIQARQWLNRLALPNLITVFEGDHRWPDAAEITAAFDWFQLQDMNRGIAAIDKRFLNDMLGNWYSRTNVLIAENKLLEATEIMDLTVRELEKHFDLDSIKTRSKEIKSSKKFKKERKASEQITSIEKSWTEKLIGRIRTEIDKPQLPQNFNWWRKELVRLDKEFIDSDLQSYQDMGKRLRNMIFAVAIENLENSVAQKNEKEIRYYAALMKANWPDNAYVYFRIANAYAALALETEALNHLVSAIDKGWKNKAWITKSQIFFLLKENPDFQSLMESLP